ncbi:MAG: hypothetical protein AB1772_08310 [Candidatus Zixiibacteriota bacterium]
MPRSIEKKSGIAFTGNALVDGATLIAVITGYGYFLLYFYEMG